MEKKFKKLVGLIMIMVLMCFGTVFLTGCGDDYESDYDDTEYDSDYDSYDSGSDYDSYNSYDSDSSYDDWDTDGNGSADWQDVDTDDDGNVSSDEMDSYLNDWENELNY